MGDVSILSVGSSTSASRSDSSSSSASVEIPAKTAVGRSFRGAILTAALTDRELPRFRDDTGWRRRTGDSAVESGRIGSRKV